MEEERDFVVFTDDDGNEFELDVIDYFDYEGEEYAILIDFSAVDESEEAQEQDVYIMKIVVTGDTEEFLPADEDKMDALAAIAEELLAEGDDDCECGEDCDCHGHDCGCGCHED